MWEKDISLEEIIYSVSELAEMATKKYNLKRTALITDYLERVTNKKIRRCYLSPFPISMSFLDQFQNYD